MHLEPWRRRVLSCTAPGRPFPKERRGPMLSFIRHSTTLRHTLFTTVVLILAGAHAFAGVVVTQNVGPGATAWPATPIVSTVSNPSAQGVVGESFAGGGGSTSYGQTFTVPEGSD